MWLRKKRQFICSETGRNSGSDDFDYDCRHASDDLRDAQCGNRNNQSLLEVLKTDIECGWSSALRFKFSFFLLPIMIFAHRFFN